MALGMDEQRGALVAAPLAVLTAAGAATLLGSRPGVAGRRAARPGRGRGGAVPGRCRPHRPHRRPGDEHGRRRMGTELRRLGWKPVSFDVVPGGHGWVAWRLELVHSLEWLGALWPAPVDRPPADAAVE
ncbi:MAG TPA: hypothetical protein VGE42_05500 [Candidatus Dormibacteraeota bacterium]